MITNLLGFHTFISYYLLNVFTYVYNEEPKIKIMEGWIDCRDCRNRYRAFIQFCPRCGSQNPYYAIIHARDRQNKRIFKKPIIIAALSVIFVVTAVMLVSGGFSRNYNNNISTNMPSGIYIAKPKTRQLEEQEQKSTDLVQYALNKINEDRSKFNLPRVQLSNNAAAQIQAEDILKARDISHWTIDGMKPYMLYSIYNGSGGVSQNIAAESNYGSTINPYRAIDLAEWTMIYNDSLCCKDLHRQDILYKLHSHVSIGIAYNEHYFAIVQNFENNYIHFNTPFIHDNETHVQISGQLPSYLSSNINLYGLDIYYDEVPTYVQYEKHKDDRSYELGKLVGFVFSPLDFNEWFEYIRSQIYSAIGISLSNYSPVPADKWHVDSRLIDIKFDISPILKKAGVYTVVLYFEDEQKNLFPVTSYSIFAKTVR
jgi:hypothetical protein